MIHYQSFKVEEVEKINEFLEKNADGIAKDGMYFAEGYLCFIYSNASKEDIEKQGLLASVHQFTAKQKGEALGKDVDIRYWRGQALKGVTNADKQVVDLSNQRDNILAQIHYAKQVGEEIEKGEYKI